MNGNDWKEPDSIFQLCDPIDGTNPLNEKLRVEFLTDNLVKINNTWEERKLPNRQAKPKIRFLKFEIPAYVT